MRIPACTVVLAAFIVLFASCGRQSRPDAVVDGQASAPPLGTAVRLDGDWLFSAGSGGSGERLLRVPGVWNGVQASFGSGRYRLLLEKLEPGRRYALQFKRIDSRGRIIVDGERIGYWGAFGLDFRPRTYWFEPKGEQAELIVEVENSALAWGGIWMPVILGAAEDVESTSARDRFWAIFVFGGILMMGLYHLALFSFRPFDLSPFFFGLFCLATGVKGGLSGEQVLTFVYAPLAGVAGLRVSYLTVIAQPILFLAYLFSLFPRKRRPRLPLAALLGFGSAQAVFSLFAPPHLLQSWFLPYQIAIMAAAVYALALVASELRAKTPGALPLAMGLALLFVAIANDILHDNKLVSTFYALDLGLWVFLFSQALVMGKLFALSFREARDLNETLEQKVSERTSELERLSRIDPLTGLNNRRQLMHLLAEEWGRWTRFRGDFCVAVIDLDHFKHINDAYGHAAGDAALKKLGELLSSSIRRTDFVGRYGGEEFCLILSGARIADAASLMEKIRQTVASTPLVSVPEKVYRTFSYGVAQASAHDGAEELLDAADRLMYQAKKAGRNRGCAEGIEPS